MTEFSGIPLAATRFGPPEAQRTPQVSPETRRAAQEFESMFLAQMMAPMFEGLDTDGLGGGGMGEEMFRPMLIEQYGQALAKAGGIGLADSIIREMAEMQANQSNVQQNQETPDGADR